MHEEKATKPYDLKDYDNAVVRVRKGQGITITVEGYEDHPVSAHFDDVLDLVLQKARETVGQRRMQRLAKEQQGLNTCGQAANYPVASNTLGWR